MCRGGLESSPAPLTGKGYIEIGGRGGTAAPLPLSPMSGLTPAPDRLGMPRSNSITVSAIGLTCTWLAYGFLAFAWAKPLPAPARVRGVVLDTSGRPIAGARIRVPGAAIVRHSDAAGVFTLPASCRGRRAQIQAAGFLPVRLRLASRVQVWLRPAPLSTNVTVTAGRLPGAPSRLPVAASQLGRARLAAAAHRNLDSILRQVAAFNTFRRDSALSAHPTTQGVSLLGLGSSGASRALVLLDGAPLNDPFGGWVDWLRVPPLAVEQVTVLSAGSSALFGNEALSGVIALATAPPVGDRWRLDAGGGGQGSGYAQAVGALARGPWGAGLRLNALHDRGYVPAAHPGRVDANAGVAAADWFPELRWSPSLNSLLRLSGEYFGEHRRNGTRLETNATALRQLTLHALEDAWGNASATAFYQADDFGSTFASIAANRNSEQLALSQHVLTLARGLAAAGSLPLPLGKALAGGSWMKVSAVDEEAAPLAPPAAQFHSNDGRQSLAGAYAGWRWRQAHPALSLTALLRYDHWRNYAALQAARDSARPYAARSSSAVSPSLGLVWRPWPILGFFAAGYESFRAPTLNELYRPFRVGNILTLANPALAAERYRGGQAGARFNWRRARFSAAWFDGRADNLVASLTLKTTPALITEQRVNLGRMRARGVLLSARFSAAHALELWLDYAHQRASILSAPASLPPGRIVPHVPANNASARLLWSPRGWQLSLGERFGGSEAENDLNTLILPAFWTTSVYLGRVLPWHAPGASRLAPYLAISNLFNRRYPVALTPSPELNPPRLLAAGLKWSWGD